MRLQLRFLVGTVAESASSRLASGSVREPRREADEAPVRRRLSALRSRTGARSEAIYERSRKTVRCVDCSPAEHAPTVNLVEEAIDTGTPGASARREYERRQAKRETRIRAKHPRLGRFILAATDDPQSTTAWHTGALGEERLGRRLNELASDTMCCFTTAASPALARTSTTSPSPRPASTSSTPRSTRGGRRSRPNPESSAASRSCWSARTVQDSIPGTAGEGTTANALRRPATRREKGSWFGSSQSLRGLRIAWQTMLI